MAGYTTRREHLEAELAELVALHNNLGQVPDRAVAEVPKRRPTPTVTSVAGWPSGLTA